MKILYGKFVKWFNQFFFPLMYKCIENKNYEDIFRVKENCHCFNSSGKGGEWGQGNSDFEEGLAKVIPQPPQDISCWIDGEHPSASIIWTNLFTSDCKLPQCIWGLGPSEMSSSTHRHYPFTVFFLFLNEIKNPMHFRKKKKKRSVYTTKWFHIWWNSSHYSVKTILKCTARK